MNLWDTITGSAFLVPVRLLCENSNHPSSEGTFPIPTPAARLLHRWIEVKVARQAGGDLRIAAPGEQAVAVLELTNLNRVLKSYDHADSAFDDPA